MSDHSSPAANPYSAPLDGDALPPDFETVFEELAVINPQVMQAGARAHSGKFYLLRRLILLLGGVLLLGITGLFVWRSWGGPPSFPMLTAGCFGFGVFALLKGLTFNWAVERRAKKSLIQSGGATQQVRYVIEPEWLGIHTDDVEFRIRYDAFFKWKDCDDVVLLYRTVKMYQIVPCNQFSHEAAAALRVRLQKFLG